MRDLPTASTPPSPPPSPRTPAIAPETATLDEPEHGLPQDRLDATDVLLWWGHKAHVAVADAMVERVVARVHQGMGLIVLHSGHFAKPFIRLMGTRCSLRWREAGERERLWVINPSHPVLAGLGPAIELPNEEMYGEPFLVPTAGDAARLLVRGRRGLPLRPHLPAWRRPHLSTSAPATRPIRPTTTPPSRPCSRTPCAGRTTPRPAWRDVGQAPNVPSTRRRKDHPQGRVAAQAGEEGYR